MNRKETRLQLLQIRIDFLINACYNRKPTVEEKKEFKFLQEEIEMLEDTGEQEDSVQFSVRWRFGLRYTE